MTDENDNVPPCPECNGDTVQFRGRGLDSQYRVCSRYREPGHLSEAETRARIESVRRAYYPTSGRFA